MMATSPREFAMAMRKLVESSQRHPATAVSDQAYQMKLQILDYFVKLDPDPEGFERLLRQRIQDPDPRKELSKGVCCQILNSWQAGSCHYTPEGQLMLHALFPADRPRAIDDEEDALSGGRDES